MDADTAARRAESVLAESARAYVRAVRAVDPDGGAAFLDVAGGCVVAGGRTAGPNISRAWGLGVDAIVDDDTALTVEAFLRARRRPVRVTLSALAAPESVATLARRRYVFVGHEAVHVVTRATAPADVEAPGDVRVERITSFDDGRFVSVYERALGGPATPPEVHRVRFAAFIAGRAAAYVAVVDERVVGAAAVVPTGDGAHLLAAAVLEDARGRGVQRALVDARLAYAWGEGATFAVATCAPVGPSATNLTRCGLRRVSVSARLELPA